MTPAEYNQLRAYARAEGVGLAVAWAASFACYVAALSQPALGLPALLLALATPLLAARALRRYRDMGREGVVSFRRGWVYVVLLFFYAALLFALVQYAYFAHIDHGQFFQRLAAALAAPEAQQMLGDGNLAADMAQNLDQMRAMRPIDIALNVLSTNLIVGVLLGMPVAAVLARREKPQQP